MGITSPPTINVVRRHSSWPRPRRNSRAIATNVNGLEGRNNAIYTPALSAKLRLFMTIPAESTTHSCAADLHRPRLRSRPLARPDERAHTRRPSAVTAVPPTPHRIPQTIFLSLLYWKVSEASHQASTSRLRLRNSHQARDRRGGLVRKYLQRDPRIVA